MQTSISTLTSIDEYVHRVGRTGRKQQPHSHKTDLSASNILAHVYKQRSTSIQN